MVADDGLHLHLVVHVHDKLLTTRGGHHIRPSLVSSLASEEIMHTKMMYPYIIDARRGSLLAFGVGLP